MARVSYRLVNVESGHADVAMVLPSGRTSIIGSVWCEKSGSTRTGIMWRARRKGGTGTLRRTAYTRAEAVRLLTGER